MSRLLALAGLMIPALALASECSVRSGSQVNAVVELYTSEGCSSCPPADRWLSSLMPAAASGRVVPLAFHVSYWDYIGWKDGFATQRATERQRAIAATAGSRYVYTPQVVIGGRDSPDWRGAGGTAAIDAIQRRAASVSMELALRVDPLGAIEASVAAKGDASMKADDVAIVVAATQSGLGSRVTAGENRGEHLAHDFVVRDFSIHRGLGRSVTTFQPSQGWKPERMTVAAFAQHVRTGEILQALSLPLCR